MTTAAQNLRNAPTTFSGSAVASAPTEWSDASVMTAQSPARARAAARRIKTAIVRGVAFFALVLGVVAALHAAINAGLRGISTSSFGTTNRIVTGQINAQIIITGSSRAQVHYDPRIIENKTGLSTYNLGRNGSQTDLQLAVLKTYLAHNAKPRLVVHNLDLFSCVTSHEIYEPAQYVPYLNEEPIYASVLRVYPDAWKWKYVPLYGYVVPDLRFTWFLGLKRLVGIEPTEDHFNGFTPRSLAWTGDFEKFRKNNPYGIHTAVEPQGLRDLEELMIVCRDHHVPLILVYSPEYFEIQSLEKNRRAIFTLFEDLCARYGVPLWDYSDSGISRQRQYFYNSQHLNAAGATAFSNEIGLRLASAGQTTAIIPAPD